LNAGLELLKGT